jgi:uncharacterized low-complexity protein
VRLLRLAASSLLVATAAVAPLAAATTASAATKPFSGHCGVIKGHGYQLPYAPYTSGSTYDVSVDDYSCSQADQAVSVLVTHKVYGEFPTRVKGGPAGFLCTATKSKEGLAYSGACGHQATKVLPFGLANMKPPWFTWTVG